jgi:hypothetical protein
VWGLLNVARLAACSHESPVGAGVGLDVVGADVGFAVGDDVVFVM